MDEFIHKINRYIPVSLCGIQSIDKLLEYLPININVTIVETGLNKYDLSYIGFTVLIVTKSNQTNQALYTHPQLESIFSWYPECIEYNPNVKKIDFMEPNEGPFCTHAVLRAIENLPNASVRICLGPTKQAPELQDVVILSPRDFAIVHASSRFGKRSSMLNFSRHLRPSLAAVFFHLQGYPDISKQIVYLLTKNGLYC